MPIFVFKVDKLEEAEQSRQEEEKEAEYKPVVMGTFESVIYQSSLLSCKL